MISPHRFHFDRTFYFIIYKIHSKVDTKKSFFFWAQCYTFCTLRHVARVIAASTSSWLLVRDLAATSVPVVFPEEEWSWWVILLISMRESCPWMYTPRLSSSVWHKSLFACLAKYWLVYISGRGWPWWWENCTLCGCCRWILLLSTLTGKTWACLGKLGLG